MRHLLLGLALLICIFLTACSKGPGALEGTWQMHGPVPMTVTYRDGEEEAMGIISQVSYKHEGDDVLVTYTSGMAEGNTIRFTKVDENTFTSELGTLKRAR